jgi:hypothetical protein
MYCLAPEPADRPSMEQVVEVCACCVVTLYNKQHSATLQQLVCEFPVPFIGCSDWPV